jgi:gamma-glutamylputrescine oxidase
MVLARECFYENFERRDLGAQIFEGVTVNDVDVAPNGRKTLLTPNGSITCNDVVICGSAYMPRLRGVEKITRAVLPVMTYACVTEPLGNDLFSIMKAPHAITDSRFACDYYRPLKDGRILWGGRVDCMGIDEMQLANILHGDMCSVYPQLATRKVEVAWPGVMGYSRHKMPLIGKLPDTPGVWYCTGFGGHGVCPTTIAGDLIASAITSGDARYKLFAPFGLSWAGGPYIGAAAAQAFYAWYESRDRMKEMFKNVS